MVFDDPPYNNYEVPLYFLRKVYCEFVLNVRPNYFDMGEFHGRDGGFAQDRPEACRRLPSTQTQGASGCPSRVERVDGATDSSGDHNVD